MNYTLTNGKESIVFGTDFVLTSFSEDGAEIRGEENAIIDGIGYLASGSSMGGKKIILEGYIKGEDVESKKRLLNRITTPSVDYFNLEDELSSIKCRLFRGVEYQKRKHQREKTISFKLTLFAPYPVWEAKNEMTDYFYSCSSSSNEEPLLIQNNGDVETGLLLRLVFLVDTSYIELTNQGKLLTIRGSFTTGDDLSIDTRRGQMGATLKVQATGKTENAMRYITADSELFKLDVGENMIGYELYGGVAHVLVAYKEGYLK